ncbi:hypothetical protein ACFWMH_27345 [Streptomyces tendae]|uniref:hypothetical protein n=1 Tax=Streptomyces tendae TaxID=1932 RepID=UPI003669C90F
MQQHEELHDKEDTCLNGVLAAVPADVLVQAQAISGYIQKASGSQLADQAAKNWDATVERFSRFFSDITQPEAETEATA